MNALELATFFSDNVYIVIKDDYAYIMDTYRLGNEEFDYGIYDRVPISELLDASFSPRSIPDAYITGYMDFLLNEDFHITYRLPKEEIEELGNALLEDWADILNADGFEDVSRDFKELCDVFKDGHVQDAMTEEQLKELVPDKNDLKWIEKWIKNYNEQWIELEKDEVEKE